MSRVGEWILRGLSRDPDSPDYPVEHYERKHQDVGVYTAILEDTFPNFRNTIAGQTVLDIGCAEGLESIALSILGARAVTGVDIRVDVERARQLQSELAPGSLITFHRLDAHHTPFPDESFEAVVTTGSFEHFRDPYALLKESRRVVRAGGRIYLTSSVWAHPWGAHMHFFTKLPWVQFLFSEKTIMSVRRAYRDDGANRYAEVEGGLNKVGVRSFRRYVTDLELETEYLSLNPVKGMSLLTKVPVINEFFTNLIIAVLRKDGPRQKTWTGAAAVMDHGGVTGLL